jgi:hypothetical protein
MPARNYERVTPERFEELERQWRRSPGFETRVSSDNSGGGIVLFQVHGDLVGTKKIDGFSGRTTCQLVTEVES